jgi:hypothetical protein
MNYEIEEFCCERCLAGNVINAIYEMSELKGDEYSSATIICKEDLTEKLLNVFISEFNFDVEFINFDRADYNKEYGVTIDTDGILSIDKAYFDDGELQTFGEDLIFISDECNSKLFINQVSFDEDAVTSYSLLNADEDEEFEKPESECDGDCENCELSEYGLIEDESVDLYDVVESMVEAILEEKFIRK